MTNKRKHLLTPEEGKQLLLAFTQCKDGDMRTNIQAVRLYGNNKPIPEINDITGLPRRTINRWYQRYQQHGLASFVDNRQGGNRRHLTTDQIKELRHKLNRYRPLDVLGESLVSTGNGLYWCVPDLKQIVWHWYKVSYKSDTSYRQLFAKCGFSYQRSEKVYRSRSEEKVAEFEEQLEKK